MLIPPCKVVYAVASMSGSAASSSATLAACSTIFSSTTSVGTPSISGGMSSALSSALFGFFFSTETTIATFSVSLPFVTLRLMSTPVTPGILSSSSSTRSFTGRTSARARWSS